MKTSGEQVDILYILLNGNADLKALISGDVYKLGRPNSGSEDIVIKTVSLVGQTKQFGTAAVNIWIPDIDAGDQTFPNTGRIDIIGDKVIELLESNINPDYNMTIGNQTVISELDLKYHYFSIKVNFEFFNL